ncbi:MAG: class I SAM-dependent methyltransferase [Burkholderiales bacterium]|nr:class I SAM-dependent methyltransferase [Flavobacterium sp.]
MDIEILNLNIQQFIEDNIGKDISKLALQKNPFPELDWILILTQIAAKSKAKTKLPLWFITPNIIYFSKIAVEQASSEKTAKHKASIISGRTLIDLTGGFGVDDYYFSTHFDTVVHCEINTELSAVVRHNFEQLQVNNIDCITGDSTKVLQGYNSSFDWIYIDPSRRNETKGKVFMLKDCTPNVPALLDFYFEYSKNILIKTAPLLDISAGLSELKNVKRVHIVAVENEVKELLWEIEKGYMDTIEILTINNTKAGDEKFNFTLEADQKSAQFGLPNKFLYEPNSAIMKSGGFDQVGLRFNLNKLHPHSHLYTAAEWTDFPGRIFQIEKVISYQKSAMKEWLENKKANLTTRNFPDSVESIRKKWKINEGGSQYCFFTTNQNNDKIVLICTKIK